MLLTTHPKCRPQWSRSSSPTEYLWLTCVIPQESWWWVVSSEAGRHGMCFLNTIWDQPVVTELLFTCFSGGCGFLEYDHEPHYSKTTLQKILSITQGPSRGLRFSISVGERSCFPIVPSQICESQNCGRKPPSPATCLLVWMSQSLDAIGRKVLNVS